MPIDWSKGKPLRVPSPPARALDPNTGSYVDIVTSKNPETGAFRSVAQDGSGKVFDWGTPQNNPSPMPAASNPSPAQTVNAPRGRTVPQNQLNVSAPTASKQTGRFAGSKLASMAGRTVVGGLIGLSIFSDATSLLNSDQERKKQAREMAKNLVDQGYTDYDAVMALAQSNPSLESAIGDIGVSDYAKTAAGIGLNLGEVIALAKLGTKAGATVGAAGGPVGIGAGALLGAGAGILGAVAQVDLQNKKASRNEAFREQFTNELIHRGLK